MSWSDFLYESLYTSGGIKRMEIAIVKFGIHRALERQKDDT